MVLDFFFFRCAMIASDSRAYVAIPVFSQCISLQGQSELCLLTAHLEDFVLQFLDRYVCLHSCACGIAWPVDVQCVYIHSLHMGKSCTVA